MEKKPSRRIPEEQAATPEEIREAIDVLRPAELLRLKKFAYFRVLGLGRASKGRNHEDLLEEAVTATLTGSRGWNKSVSFVQHLLGAIRSIASHWGEEFDPGEALLEAEVTSTTPEGEEYSPLLNAPSTSPDGERVLVAKQEVEAIERLFAEDPQVLEIIGGLRAEMTGPEIQEALSLSKTEYETARRRMRRGIQRIASTRESSVGESHGATKPCGALSIVPKGENHV